MIPKESYVQSGGGGRSGFGGSGGIRNLVITKNGGAHDQVSSSSSKSSTRFSIMMMPSFLFIVLVVWFLVVIWYQNIVHFGSTLSILHTIDVDNTFLQRHSNAQDDAKHQKQLLLQRHQQNHHHHHYNLPIKKKYAIYMTTHMSSEHRDFLTNCWPTAIKTLPLLQHADFIVYASGNNTNNQHDILLRQVLSDGGGGGGDGTNTSTTNTTTRSITTSRKVHIYRHKQKSIRQYGPKWRTNVKKQDGAVKAMVDPFLVVGGDENENENKKSSWFDGYDWIVRLNPDVLIRDDTWLLETMEDSNANNAYDAIVIPFTSKKFTNVLHSDFFAFKPNAINGTALIEMYRQQKKDDTIHAESHVYSGFQHLIENGRVTTLPNASHRKYHARTTGPDCDIIHDHKMLHYCPNYFNSHPT